MKKATVLIAMAGLCVVSANASIENETIVVAQAGVTTGNLPPYGSPVTTMSTLNFVGNQFDPTLGTLDSVSLTLTANLRDSTLGGGRLAAGDPFAITWSYDGSLTLSSLPSLSSTWNSSGSTTINPQPPGNFISEPLGLTDPTSSTTLNSGLSQFIGGSTFDLAAALDTTAGWYFTQTDPGEFGAFNPFAGGTLEVTYDYTATAVPEPSTLFAGAMLLLPFGASTMRILRKKKTV
jgi:hypothetical protein